MASTLQTNDLTREQAVDEVKVLYRVLYADVVAAKGLHGTATADTQFARRVLVRAYFALFEGLSFQLRQITLATDGGRSIILTPEEYAMLQEKERRLPVKCSLIQSLRHYAKCHRKNSYEPNRHSPGWHAMTCAIKMRHRITHPKSASALFISDAEHKQMLDAGLWWADSVRELLTACEDSDARFRRYEKTRSNVSFRTVGPETA